MKIIYTILFFAGTSILLLFAFLLLKMIDTGSTLLHFFISILGMLLCIGMLFYFLIHYVNNPN